MKRIITLLFLSLCVYVAKAQYSGSGSGTAESPYLITTAMNVEEIRNFQDVKDVQFKLMNDVDMSELIEDSYGTEGWNPISSFKGEFDGNGYSISGLYINRPNFDGVGFFGGVGGYIHDLTLVYSGDIIGSERVGGLCGSTGSQSTIERCIIKTINISGTTYVGGLCGFAGECNIKCCLVNGNKISGTTYVGGLIGQNESSSRYKIEECIVEWNQIDGGFCCGGLIGVTNATITNNRVYANITESKKNGRYSIGGIIGKGSTSGSVSKNLFEGKLIAKDFKGNLGGILGQGFGALIVSNVSVCDSIIYYISTDTYVGRISPYQDGLSDITATNANRAYNKTVIHELLFNSSTYAEDSKKNGVGAGNILLKSANMYKGMGWDMDNVWLIDEGNSYPRLKWEVEMGLSKPTLSITINDTLIGENDIIPFFAEKITNNLGGGISYTYYECAPDAPIIANTSSRTQQITVTVTSQDYSHLKWAGIDGQNADMKESSESRTCQLERGASVPLKLHAVFADQDFGSYSATVNVSCEDYSRTFQITFTNENPYKPVCPTPVIDYSEGKLVFSCNVEGTPEYHVTITDPDVTTHVVGHELDIERTYTVEVFATAEGYQASETTKLILCWIDAKISDSVEGIISEKGLPLKIRMGNGLVTISGVGNNTLVSAYTLDGVLLDSTTSTSETVTLTIPSSTEVIVLKVGDNSVKIVF